MVNLSWALPANNRGLELAGISIGDRVAMKNIDWLHRYYPGFDTTVDVGDTAEVVDIFLPHRLQVQWDDGTKLAGQVTQVYVQNVDKINS